MTVSSASLQHALLLKTFDASLAQDGVHGSPAHV